jgi:hypothetical protein
MPSIDGRLEWDDDELTPGKEKERGLHSTLFDADGNLKSSARFVPFRSGRGTTSPTAEAGGRGRVGAAHLVPVGS